MGEDPGDLPLRLMRHGAIGHDPDLPTAHSESGECGQDRPVGSATIEVAASVGRDQFLNRLVPAESLLCSGPDRVPIGETVPVHLAEPFDLVLSEPSRGDVPCGLLPVCAGPIEERVVEIEQSDLRLSARRGPFPNHPVIVSGRPGSSGLVPRY